MNVWDWDVWDFLLKHIISLTPVSAVVETGEQMGHMENGLSV